MPKMTAKRKAAESTAISNGIKHREFLKMTNDDLYGFLTDKGHIWNAKAGAWEIGSTSMFSDSDGDATGVVRLRVMAHPDDVLKAVKLLKQKLGKDAQIVEVSDPYPNRRGTGVRIYSTLVLS